MVTLEETKIDPSLLENVKIPCNWSEYICEVGSSLDLQSGLIAGGKDTKGRQTVFFTAVNPMTDLQEEESYDVMKPQRSRTKQSGKCIRTQKIGTR